MTPAGAVLGRQPGDGDVGATDLERADRLERLGLQQPAGLLRAEAGRAASAGRRRARVPAAARMSSIETSRSAGGAVIGPRPRASGSRCSRPPTAGPRGGRRRSHCHTGRQLPERPVVEPGEGGLDQRKLLLGLRRAGRGRAAGRRPGWRRRPASRRSSGRAPRSRRRARAAAGRARLRARARRREAHRVHPTMLRRAPVRRARGILPGSTDRRGWDAWELR